MICEKDRYAVAEMEFIFRHCKNRCYRIGSYYEEILRWRLLNKIKSNKMVKIIENLNPYSSIHHGMFYSPTDKLTIEIKKFLIKLKINYNFNAKTCGLIIMIVRQKILSIRDLFLVLIYYNKFKKKDEEFIIENLFGKNFTFIRILLKDKRILEKIVHHYKNLL